MVDFSSELLIPPRAPFRSLFSPYTPVSYTHLDVYKRQGQKVYPTGFRLGITENWRSRWFAEKDYAKTLGNDLEIRKSVSYTHLDVYKRQGRPCARGHVDGRGVYSRQCGTMRCKGCNWRAVGIGFDRGGCHEQPCLLYTSRCV